MGRFRSLIINAQIVVLVAVVFVSLGAEALGWGAYAIATGSMEPSVFWGPWQSVPLSGAGRL